MSRNALNSDQFPERPAVSVTTEIVRHPWREARQLRKRQDELQQGAGVHHLENTRMHEIIGAVPKKEHELRVAFHHAGEGKNHTLSVASTGKEYLKGAGRTGGRQYGSMIWGADTGEIKGISVEKEHQRKGIATAMLHTARELAKQHGLPTPVHSDTQTDEGAAWADRAK